MDRITEADVKQEEIIYRQPNKVEVFRVRHYRTNEILCMKKIFVENVNDATSIQSECLAMAYFDHPNILKLRSASLGGFDREITHVIIFMDYFPEGDLEKLIITRERSKNYFTEEEIFMYLGQLIGAYAHLQDKNVAHRDIKPQNIFVKDNGATLKIGDLVSAVKKDINSGVTFMGTPLYLSPKLREAFARGNTYGNLSINHDVYKSDVYSLGLTILYMVSLQNVKDLCTLPDLQNKIGKRIQDLPQRYNKLKPYLYHMLVVDESQRKNFIELREMLIQKGKDVVITEENYIDIGYAEVLPFAATCECCGLQKNETEIYVFTSGLICKTCYDLAIKKLAPDRE